MHAPAAGRAEKLLLAEARANPNNLGARRNLALLDMEHGRYSQAVAQLKIILAARPQDREAKNLLDLIEVMRKSQGG